MPLPPGFELESTPAAVKLPPGFELEPQEKKKPTREELIAAIPGGETAPVSEVPGPRRSIKDVVIGTAEVPLAVGQGLIALPAGAASALYKKATGQPSNIGQEIARFSYQPTTETGRESLQQLGAAFEASKLPPMPGITGGLATAGATRLAGPAVQQAVASPVGQALTQEAGLVAQAAKYPFEQRAAAKQAQRVAQSYQRAPQIEAAKEAQQYGINLNPETSNPSVKAKVVNMIAGSDDANQVLSKSNKETWNQMAREDMDLPPTTTLNAKAFEEARNNPTIAKPYEQVRSLPTLASDPQVIANIEALQTPSLIGGETVAGIVKQKIDSAIRNIERGMDGAEVLRNIKELRRAANETYAVQSKGVTQIPEGAKAVADVQMGIATALESLIEGNIRDPKLLSEFRAARTKYAQIYDWERATDIATGQVDPSVLAKMVRENKLLSDRQAAAGRIAANFPEIADVKGAHNIVPRVTRTGLMGGLGATLGWSVGGYPGLVMGGALGGTAAEAGRLGTLSYMRSPGFQAGMAIPMDYRLPVANQLAQQRAPITANAMVPYDWQQSVNAGEPTYQPNWVYGQRGVEPNVQAGMPAGAPQLPPPTPEVVQNALRAEDARRMRMGGLTPEQEAAVSAVEMQRPFNTRTEIVAELNKIIEQAKGFEEIAKRAKDADARRQAMVARERLMDYADQLEEQLRSGRPVAKTGQGPKTREAQRNRLAPNNINELAR